jgi:hypothetical protein
VSRDAMSTRPRITSSRSGTSARPSGWRGASMSPVMTAPSTRHVRGRVGTQVPAYSATPPDYAGSRERDPHDHRSGRRTTPPLDHHDTTARSRVRGRGGRGGRGGRVRHRLPTRRDPRRRHLALKSITSNAPPGDLGEP